MLITVLTILIAGYFLNLNTPWFFSIGFLTMTLLFLFFFWAFLNLFGLFQVVLNLYQRSCDLK